MKKSVLIGIIIGVAVLAVVGWFLMRGEKIKSGGVSSECDIENPDPDGYLLKICEYLVENKDTIITDTTNPSEYNIISIEEGVYSRFENGKHIETDAIIVSLDCCYMGDIAYISKETKEVIGFSPGDM